MAEGTCVGNNHVLVIKSTHDSLPEPVRIASSFADHLLSRAENMLVRIEFSATITHTHSGAELTADVLC